MSLIIDFHTHIFPDHVAKNAIPLLENEGNVQAFLDGTEQALLKSMQQAEISKSVVCSIATKPEQFQSILIFSDKIRSEKIVPFPSLHPRDPSAISHIKQIKDEGFKGIKMHPFYQDFYMDDEEMMPIYAEISELGLILLMHTGFDIAFPFIRRADPARILKVIDIFPDLKLVTSHFGAWKLWKEVKACLIGKPIYMDLSYALDFMDRSEVIKMIESHPAGYLLFGSDSPWASQQHEIETIRKLNLDKKLEESILGLNASKLLQ